MKFSGQTMWPLLMMYFQFLSKGANTNQAHKLIKNDDARIGPINGKFLKRFYAWKCTNKEKLISLHVNNCECGVAVGRPCLPWGQGLKFNQ